MTHKEKAQELIARFDNRHYAIIDVQDRIEENQSVLEMLKIHGNERSRVPVLARIDYLKAIKKELTQL